MNPNIVTLAGALMLPTGRAQEYNAALVSACDAHEIATPAQVGMFLMQIAASSRGLQTPDLSALTQSAEDLCRLWPGAFVHPNDAEPYALDAEKTANWVYANQHGNGDEASGDGWLYRPRGLLPVWGLADYAAIGYAANPEDLDQPSAAANAAAAQWQATGCSAYADANDLNGCTAALLGGLADMARRRMLWSRVLGVMNTWAAPPFAGISTMIATEPMQTGPAATPDYAVSS